MLVVQMWWFGLDVVSKDGCEAGRVISCNNHLRWQYLDLLGMEV